MTYTPDHRWVCQHTECLHCLSSDERIRYKTRSGVLRHMKNRRHHPCAFDIKYSCSACWKLREKMQGESLRVIKTRYACRHTDCLKTYAHQSSRWRHETGKKHTCLGECVGCEVAGNFARRVRPRITFPVLPMPLHEETINDVTQRIYEHLGSGGVFTISSLSKLQDVLDNGNNKMIVFWEEEEEEGEKEDTSGEKNTTIYGLQLC